jgi:hypothetical protein
MFRHQFEYPKYQDAPNLSDQLLLPCIANGFNLFLISSYVPTYVVRLLRDLASSPEIESGKVSWTLYFPAAPVTEQNAVGRLHQNLSQSIPTSSNLNEFIQDILQISAEGGLSVQLLYGPPRKNYVKGTIGVLVEEKTEEYVSFEDKKPGDYNSPIFPKRSWLAEEISAAEALLIRINKALQANYAGTHLVDSHRFTSWLVAISQAISSDASKTEDPLASDQKTNDDGVGNEFVDEQGASILEDTDYIFDYDFLSESPDQTFGFPKDGADPLDDYFFSGFSIPVTEEDLDLHHIPPVPPQLVGIIGQASAVCFCGRKFNRVSGCPEIVW